MAAVADGMLTSVLEVVTAAEVGSGDTSKEVSVSFGSVTVVVPDGVAVDEGGLVAFGSVKILTQSEYDANSRA